MPDDPTPGEIMRRLDELGRTMQQLAATLESSYVRREVYEAKHEALRSYVDARTKETEAKIKENADDIGDLNRHRQSDQSFRRQIITGAAVGAILLVLNLLFAINGFTGGSLPGGK